MGACASKPKTIEGKAPQQEVPAQQTPKVAPNTTNIDVSTDQVAADQIPEKVVVEEAKLEETTVAPEEVPNVDAILVEEKVEAVTFEPAIDTKEAEVVEEKIVVEEEKPSAGPVVLVEAETTVAEADEEIKPLAATIVVKESTMEVITKNTVEENDVEEKVATQQS
ncbi:unnamed protein product [Alopecurus aequalis]